VRIVPLVIKMTAVRSSSYLTTWQSNLLRDLAFSKGQSSRIKVPYFTSDLSSLVKNRANVSAILKNFLRAR
jgi:hypothetical protein